MNFVSAEIYPQRRRSLRALAALGAALAILIPIAVFGALPASGPVLAWGANSPQAAEVGGLAGKVTKIAAGEGTAPQSTHSLALLEDGTVRAWGAGSSGQLGQGAQASSATPVQVDNLSQVVDIAAGQQHSLALKSDGTVWAWGAAGCGQLGAQPSVPAGGVLGQVSTRPVQVLGLPPGIKAIAAGRAFNLALDTNGRLWAWGDNRSGQLGNGVPAHPRPPDFIVFGCYARGDTGTAQLAPTPVALADEVVSFDAGSDHVLALTKRGQVWSWGSDCEGQLGNPVPGAPTPALGRGAPAPVGGLPDGHVVAVAAGGADFGGHSLALTDDGQVFSWGLAELLGAGAQDTQPTTCVNVDYPMSRGGGHSAPVQVQKGDGSSLTDVVALAAGADHSLAVTADGGLVSWGRNSRGQLGVEGAEARTSAVPVALATTGGAPFVAMAAAGRQSLAVMGNQPPARPSPEFTGTVPLPSDFPPDVTGDINKPLEDINDAVEETQQTVLDALEKPVPAAEDAAEEAQHIEPPSIPATERVAVPRIEPPVPGTGGGVFVMGYSDMEDETWGHPCSVQPPQTTCNTAGARYLLRRAVSYVTPGKSAPRLLLVSGSHAPIYADIRGAGFARGCPADPGLPVAFPGCFDVTMASGDLLRAESFCRPAPPPTRGGPPGPSPCHPDWRPDNDVSKVDFNDYDGIVVGSIMPFWPDSAGRVLGLQRRQQLIDYVNSGHGLVMFGQANGYQSNPPPGDEGDTGHPAGMECRFESGPDANGREYCRAGVYQYLPFLNDPEYSEEFVKLLSPTDFLSVAEAGKQLGLADEDVNEYRQRPDTWFSESCGFDVFLTDKFQRISAMGTHKKIPDETKCSGVSADPASVVEGNAGTRPLTFEIKLNSVRSPDAVGSIQETTQKVHFRTVDGSATKADNDYIPTEGTLEFNTQPGSAEGGPQSVTVQVVGDTAVETDETINLHLTGEGVSEFEQTIVGTIVNDDGLPTDGQAGKQEGVPPPNAQGGQNNLLGQPGGPVSAAVPGSVPAPASAQAQAVAQVQAPGAQAQAQSQSQAQGQSQVQAQSHANAPQVAVMKEKQKQEQLQRAYTNNQLVPAELLATSRRPNPVMPLVIMAGSVISALGLALFRRGLSPSSQEEKVPQEGEDQSDRPLWLRRKRSQR